MYSYAYRRYDNDRNISNYTENQYEDNMFIRVISMLEYLMQAAGVKDLKHLKELESRGELDDKQKVMNECLSLITGVFENSEDKCNTEFLDMAHQWCAYLNQCVPKVIEGYGIESKSNASDVEKFIYDISSQLRVQALGYMVRNDRSVVNPISAVETRTDIFKDYSKVFNIQKSYL